MNMTQLVPAKDAQPHPDFGVPQDTQLSSLGAKQILYLGPEAVWAFSQPAGGGGYWLHLYFF